MKHKPVQQNKFLNIKDGKIERTRRICDRCGDGTYMAEHANRWYCGKCHLTIWKQASQL